MTTDVKQIAPDAWVVVRDGVELGHVFETVVGYQATPLETVGEESYHETKAEAIDRLMKYERKTLF